MKSNKRKSKHEITEDLIKQQRADDKTQVVWPEVITPHVVREYDCFFGDNWRIKAFYVLFRLNWREEWISQAMDISIRNVRRIKKKLKKLSYPKPLR